MGELAAVEVGELAPAEAAEMFTRCGKLGNATGAVREEMVLIVAELDYLAMAVTLAGAYVAATPRICSKIAEYPPQFRRRWKALLGRKAKQQIRQYGESVLSTWGTSHAAIEKQFPVEVRLLSFFAFLDPEDIYLDLLRYEVDPSLVGNASTDEDWRKCLWSEGPLEDTLDEALEALSTYSLIQWKEEQAGYSMHKVVHAWGFDRFGVEEQGRYSQGSLALLGLVIRDSQLDPFKKSRITSHISSGVARLREGTKGSTEVSKWTLSTMCSLAHLMRSTGQYEMEFELRAFEESDCAQVKADDEAGWLGSLSSNLASVLRYQGRYKAAEEMNRRALEGYEKLLGKEHADTPTSIYCLACDRDCGEESDVYIRASIKAAHPVWYIFT